jgi:hypothetical protein
MRLVLRTLANFWNLVDYEAWRAVEANLSCFRPKSCARYTDVILIEMWLFWWAFTGLSLSVKDESLRANDAILLRNRPIPFT